MDKQDKDVLAKFILILGVLVLIAVVAFLAAKLASTVDHNSTAGGGTDEFAQMQLAKVSERIAPVGHVIAGEVATGPIIRSGKEITEAVCTSCHGSGVLNAPKIGEAGDWSSRMVAGLDAIVTSAINGKGSMPARGGDGSLSDDDVRKAVIYMLKESGQDVPDEGGSSSAAAESGDKPAAEPTTAVETAVETSDKAPAVATVAVANETVIDPETIKIYKSACSSCHDNGVANAPAPGDTPAWTDRIAAGIDAIYTNAIGGKGAMPPKGGRMDLSDDAIKSVVDYMLSETR